MGCVEHPVIPPKVEHKLTELSLSKVRATGCPMIDGGHLDSALERN
jgi:hypothetical protein